MNSFKGSFLIYKFNKSTLHKLRWTINSFDISQKPINQINFEFWCCNWLCSCGSFWWGGLISSWCKGVDTSSVKIIETLAFKTTMVPQSCSFIVHIKPNIYLPLTIIIKKKESNDHLTWFIYVNLHYLRIYYSAPLGHVYLP